jgi:hypothetical protein
MEVDGANAEADAMIRVDTAAVNFILILFNSYKYISTNMLLIWERK